MAGLPVISAKKTHPGFGFGLRSLLRTALAPVGELQATFHKGLSGATRLEHGLILILPGIEGCSTINDNIARGLVAGRMPHAIRILHWSRFRFWNPFHLVMKKYNRQQARRIAQLIQRYCHEYPGRPVHLIGHSAGGGMAMFILQELPSDVCVDSVILLAAAVSRTFDFRGVLDRTRRGIWNFFSPLDLPAAGFGTVLFGTMDRRHTLSIGAIGLGRQWWFHKQASIHGLPVDAGRQPRLHQIRFGLHMVTSWNLGGHFGWTNSAFVQKHLVPICTDTRIGSLRSEYYESYDR